LKASMLWYVKSCDFDENNSLTSDDKKTIIFESLQKGYWEK
jgi:hypothetical protein